MRQRGTVIFKLNATIVDPVAASANSLSANRCWQDCAQTKDPKFVQADHLRGLNKIYGVSHPKTSQNILIYPRDRLSSSI